MKKASQLFGSRPFLALLQALSIGLLSRPFPAYAVEIAAISEHKIEVVAPSDRKAMAIASASGLVQQNMQGLRDEIAKVKDSQLRTDLAEILERPRFSVVSFRKADEAQIVHDLQENHLLENDVRHIFPDHAAMPFIAAPGSIWRQHHTYPGGLVDHTLANLRNALSMAENFVQTYNTAPLNLDMLRAAAIWHDSAKTMTLQWNEDGSASASEGPQIAGTGAHHIWAIAEALYRGYPADFIVVLASAHSPAHPTKGLNDLIGYLQAAAIISGRPVEAAGLTRVDSKLVLAEPPRIEGFLNHLSDHDYVMTETALPLVTDVIRRAIDENGSLLGSDPVNWKIDVVFAQYGEGLYPVFLAEGPEGVRNRLSLLDKKLHPQ